jgi:hypothetical protein
VTRYDVGFAILMVVAILVILYMLGSFIGKLLRRRSDEYPVISYYVIRDEDPDVENLVRIGPYQNKQRALDANYFYLQGQGIVARLIHYPSGISELIRVWPKDPKPEIGSSSSDTSNN